MRGASRFMGAKCGGRRAFVLHRFGMKSSSFAELVASVIRAIPKGTTLSYAAVALRANRPGGARSVARALRTLEGVPWWRVVKSDGTVAKEMASRQIPRLRRE